MLTLIDKFLAFFTSFQMNILLLLGLALFGGAAGGRLFQKFKIPQVVGYIAIGIIIGESGFNFVDHTTVIALQPFSYFALGLIGFMIGGELKKDVLIKYGRQFIAILCLEGVTAFIAVTLLVGFMGQLILGDIRLAWALALLLGAIASATAPAATVQVLREFKCRGPLTRTVLGIVAMDDALALILFALASSIAAALTGKLLQEDTFRIFIHPLYEIGAAVLIGIVSGFVLNKLLVKYSEKERVLAFSLGTVLFVCGLTLTLHVDMLLAMMILGVIVVNFLPRKSKEVFKLIEGFSAPIYVLFFVLVGAKLNISHVTRPVVILGLVYLFARGCGKMIGAYAGAKISHAPKTVQRNLPFCLFSQAGVAIGLSILASTYFPGQIGDSIVVIVTSTVFVLEIIGPWFVKFAAIRSGEAGLDVTEEDLLEHTRVDEVMDAHPPLIHENMPLQRIFQIFSESPYLYYPVVDAHKKLLGVITIDSIKKVFMETGMNELFLAVDAMDPVPAKVYTGMHICEVREVLDRYNLEYVPVVTDADVLVGFLERRMVFKYISQKMLEYQRKADVLDN